MAKKKNQKIALKILRVKLENQRREKNERKKNKSSTPKGQ